jgi:hypothetical protein
MFNKGMGYIACICIVSSHYEYAGDAGTRAKPINWESVSLVGLIAVPERFHKKRVEVVGYFKFDFETSELFLSADDAAINNWQNSIHIGTVGGVWKNITEAEIAAINGHFVRLRGRFLRGITSGHQELWKGEMTEVTQITPIIRENEGVK